jgi:hypothetical protein
MVLAYFFQIINPSVSILTHFYQIQAPLDLVQKPNLDPCAHYTLPNARNYTKTRFYKKIKHGYL